MKLAVSKGFNYMYLGAGFLRNAVADLFSSRLAQVYFFSALGVDLIAWLAANRIVAALGDNLAVLHYNVIFGIDLVGSPNRIYFMPLFGLLVVITNFLLISVITSRRDRLLVHFALGSAAAINVFTLVAIYFIYLINFS